MGGISSKVDSRKWSRQRRQPISKRTTLIGLLADTTVPGGVKSLPSDVASTFHQVELEVSALSLHTSNSSTLCMVETRGEDEEEWTELGRTETIIGKRSPHYQRFGR